jgi:Ca2+-binding EF-hand superfamily protein
MKNLLLILLLGLLSVQVSAHGKGKWMKKHFEEMDTNKDGKVSKEEWNAFHDTKFSSMDKDNDGFVTHEEFKAHKKEKKEKRKK